MKIKNVIISVLLVLVCQLAFGKSKGSSNRSCVNELKTHYYSCGEMPFGTSRRADGILTKTAYGIDDLSTYAFNFRKTLATPNHRGNIAVIEYLDNNVPKKKAFTTLPGDRSHTEMMAVKFCENNNIPKQNVTRIYSELEPCEITKHECKILIQDNFPNAAKSYSYSYPGQGVPNYLTIRDASLDARYAKLQILLQ